MSCACMEGGMQPLGPTVVTQLAKVAELNALTGAGGPYESSEVGLFINNVVPTANTELTDLVQPSWSSYVLAGLTWGTAAAEGPEGAAVYAASVLFTSDSTANDMVYGCFIRGGSSVLQRAMLFDTPIPVVGVQNIPIVPALFDA